MDRRVAGRRRPRCHPSRRRLFGARRSGGPRDRNGVWPGGLRTQRPERGASASAATIRGHPPVDPALERPGGSYRLGAGDFAGGPADGMAALAGPGHTGFLPHHGRRSVQPFAGRGQVVDLPGRRRRPAQPGSSDRPRGAAAASRPPGHLDGGDPRASDPIDGRVTARIARRRHGGRRRTDPVPEFRDRGSNRRAIAGASNDREWSTRRLSPRHPA